jgi:hypothetical protein
MNERIVVWLQWAAGLGIDADSQAERRLAELIRRARAFGSELVAWSGDAIAFAFEHDDVEEAVSFCAAPHMQPLLIGARGGIAVGVVRLLGFEGDGHLGIGEGIIKARVLASEADDGEILVEEAALGGVHLSQPLGEPRQCRKWQCVSSPQQYTTNSLRLNAD